MGRPPTDRPSGKRHVGDRERNPNKQEREKSTQKTMNGEEEFVSWRKLSGENKTSKNLFFVQAKNAGWETSLSLVNCPKKDESGS